MFPFISIPSGNLQVYLEIFLLICAENQSSGFFIMLHNTLNFIFIPGVEILTKKEFRAIHLKLCGNYAFAQNFYTRKLGQTTVI